MLDNHSTERHEVCAFKTFKTKLTSLSDASLFLLHPFDGKLEKEHFDLLHSVACSPTFF